MSKQTLELRGRRARAERRRVEKALKRRLEADEALLDDALDGTGPDAVPSGTGVDDAPDGTAVDEARPGPNTDDRPGGARVNGTPDGTGAAEAPNGRNASAASAEVVWSGLVAGVQRGGALTVLANGRAYGASLARELVRQGYALSVGDHVQAILDTPGRVTIVGVEPRRTKLARVREDRTRRSEFAREEAVLAANVDVAVIVAAVADPPFHPKLVDRFLVICQYGGIWPVLCLNKCDLVDEPPDLTIYEQLGLPIVYASAATGAGLDELRHYLHGNVAVFTGHSGVGKSSLVNALLGQDHQVVGAVRSADGRGRHTTTSSSLLRLDDDSYLVDTPGVRSLGIWKIDPRTLGAYFPDFDPFSASCRFSTCSHVHEPACAVKEAVEAGEIPRQRYESYLRMREG